MTSSNTDFDLTEKADILIKTAFGFPSTNENTPWYSEVFIPFDNYVFGDEVLVQGVPSSPVFDTVKTASDINLDTSDFTGYSADTNNISGCSIVDDSTGTVRRYQGLILDTISNGLNTNADGSQSWRKLDNNGNNILKNGLQFNYKQQGSTQPYLYLLSKKNGGSIPFGSSGGNWYIDLKSGVLLFNDYSTSICSVSNPPVLTYYTYIGEKGLSNFAGGSGGGGSASSADGNFNVTGDIIGSEDLELNAGIIIQDDFIIDSSATRVFPDARFEKLEVHDGLTVYGDISVNNFNVVKNVTFSGDITSDTLNTANIIQFDQTGTTLDIDLSGDVYRNSISTFGDIDAGGNLSVSGDASLNSGLTVGSDVNFNSGLTVGGKVGIGTASPERSLSIYDAANPAIQLFNNSGTAGLALEQFESSTYFTNRENGNIYFRTQNDAIRMTMLENGRIGLGTISPAYFLDVIAINHRTSHTYSRYRSFSAYHEFNASTSSSTGSDFGMRCDSNIAATAFLAFSDRRIKNNITEMNDDTSLQKLRLLKPCTYEYKDKISRGTSIVEGFIAQEVKEVLPYAVNNILQDIPNIYKIGSYDIDASNNKVITINDYDTANLELDASGNVFPKLKVLLEDNSVEYVTISSVISPSSIVIESEKDIPSGEIFIYGQNVDNFCSLDKDRIFTVATSALQEVDRQLQAEKTKVATLETQLADVLTRLAALESA